MCKFCWGLSVVLIAVVAGMGYMFMFRGNVTPGNDGRTAIILSAGERDLVLGEMRSFLETVQLITAAIGEKDMKTIAEATRKVGMANARQVPVSLMSKLPMEFKTMGMATHKAFDALGMEAQDMGDPQKILQSLSDMLLTCTTCHSGYRLVAEKSGGK